MSKKSTEIASIPEATEVVSGTTSDTLDTIDNKTKKMSIPSFYKDGEFLYADLGKFLINNLNVIRLNNVNHIRINGIYWHDSELIEYAMQKVCSKIKPAERKLVLDYLHIATKMSTNTESSCEYVGFNNGVLNILSGDFKPFPTDVILTNKLCIDYEDFEVVKSSANVNLIDKYFDEATNGNAELKEYLYYTIADGCVRGIIEPTVFVLSGDSNRDGRNIFVDIFNTALGDCVAHENLESLASGNSSVTLYSKTCNISNEQEPPKIKNMNTLRALVCGNKIIDKKSSLEYKPYATMIFNVTDISNFDGSFMGLNGYFKIIPFNSKVTLDRTELDILLSTVNIQYITLKALQVYADVLNSDSKTINIPKVVEVATTQYLLNSNSAREFILNNPIIEVVKKIDYYTQYAKWCEQNNKSLVTRVQFGKEVLKFGYKPARYTNSQGNRLNYYIIPNFNIEKCREKYMHYLQDDRPTYTEVAGEHNADGKFIDALTDYFTRHNLDEVPEDKTLLEQLENGTKTMEIIENMPNVVLEDKEPQ